MSDVATKPMSVLTCDLLASQHISPKDLTKERDLMRSCWWEYRGMHPTKRTNLFARVYREMTQHFHGKYRDYAKAMDKSGLAGGQSDRIFPTALDNEKLVIRKKRNLVGLWRARQAADELGISYTIYISACFEKASLCGWQNLPRPTQLYSDKMKMVALDEQVKEIERFIPDFTNPNLLSGSTAPFKADFDAWLFELGSLRKIHKELAFNRMAQQGYINQEQADAWATLAREDV